MRDTLALAPMSFVLRAALSATLAAVLACPLLAQTTETAPRQDPVVPTQRELDARAALVAIASQLRAIEQKQAELRAKQVEAAAETVELQRLALLGEVGQLQREVAEKDQTLQFVASGIEPPAAKVKLDVLGEIEEIVRPVIDGLKELTADSRQLDALEADITAETRRIEAIERGTERVRRLRGVAQAELGKAPADALLPRASLEALVGALDRVEANWQRERDLALSNRQLLEYRVAERKRDRRPFLETAQALIGGFFRERGLNVLLAILAFCTVLLGLRWLYRPFAKRIPRDRRHSFSLRLLSVLYHLLVGVLSFTAALVVLYIADDWVLLGLAALFILGLAWAGKQTLPRFYHEARLLLNVGEVREGERVIVDGLPWRVDRLHIHTRLVNPALTGGVLRLPLRDLISLRSRPSSDREPWFPCFEGDWVLVDGLFARVLVQTPQTVEVVTQGSRRTWSTAQFLGASPTNLSGGFGFRVNFGLDYRHQAIATTEIPALMRRALEERLALVTGGDGLVALKAELAQAGSSSLDYAVVAEFKGSSAQYYLALQRHVQRILVDLCNEHGWVIPFPQLTVHRA